MTGAFAHAQSGVEVWNGYTTREAAEFVGLSESIVRSCVRAGLLSADGTGIPARFCFTDLKVLKLVKSLGGQGLSLRRIREQLGELQGRLAPKASLAEFNLAALGGNVVVHDTSDGARRAWRADNGQLLLGFEASEPAGEMAIFASRAAGLVPGGGQLLSPGHAAGSVHGTRTAHATGSAPTNGSGDASGASPYDLDAGAASAPPAHLATGIEPVMSLTADAWFDRGLELEECDPHAAMTAYGRALRLRPDCTETLINLGRLRAESGDPEGAADCFREALDLDPADPTAMYNLGVVAQDTGDDTGAVQLYEQALALDPSLSEAHYNLATIFDRTGDPRAAIRHINEYRKLT